MLQVTPLYSIAYVQKGYVVNNLSTFVVNYKGNLSCMLIRDLIN